MPMNLPIGRPRRDTNKRRNFCAGSHLQKLDSDGITAVNIQAISVTADKTTAWVSSGNGLAKSTNFSSPTPTWQWPILPCAPQRCDPSGIGASVWVKPDDPNIVLAGSIGGFIFRSADAGATWVLASAPSIDIAKFVTNGWNLLRPYQFTNDPNDPSIVYVTLAGPSTGQEWIGAVLKSADSGATWSDLSITADAPASAIAVIKTGVLYVGSGYGKSSVKGIFKYSAGVWAKLNGIPADVNINSIMIDPDNESIIYVAAAGDGRVGHDGFYKSSDAGTTWKKSLGLENLYNFTDITVQRSTTPNTIYVTCRDNAWHGLILKSSDAGETWGVLYTGLKQETFNSVIFDGLIAVSKHGVMSLKSKVNLGLKNTALAVKKNLKFKVSGKLTDATTKKILKNKIIELQQYVGKKWVTKAGGKVDQKGKFGFSIKVTKAAKYRVVWKPGKVDRTEYAAALPAIRAGHRANN